MRIFDRVASGDAIFCRDDDQITELPAKLQAEWRKAAHTATRVVADEAAQYEAQSDTRRDVRSGDYGTMRLPFDDVWVEWRTPGVFWDDGSWHRRQRMRMACVIGERDATTLDIAALVTFDNSELSLFPIAARIDNFNDINSIGLSVDFVANLNPAEEVFGSLNEAAYELQSAFDPAYLTLGWLNCRNVSTTDVTPAAKLAAKRKRRNQPLGLAYKRIVVEEQTRRSLSTNQEAERCGKRLHIVRGHIKHYTAERPLFGKLTGNYWWHQQMRGDAALGRINHEYHVQAKGTR